MDDNQRMKIRYFGYLNQGALKGQILFTGSSLMEMFPVCEIARSQGIEQAGAFECPECKERFVPDMKSYVMGPHTITKRKLTCPKCGCTKYCKHVLTR